MKKTISLFLLAALMLSLVSCRQAATDTQTGSSAAESTVAGQALTESAGTASIETEAASTDAEVLAGTKRLYESAHITVDLVDLLEDTLTYHVLMRAENKTGKDIDLEIKALAFNGITADASSADTVPASGNAYLHLSCDKKNLNYAGLTGKPGTVKAAFTVYDENYEVVDEGIAECVVDGANSKPVASPEGETVYNEGGIVIRSLGLVEDSYFGQSLNLLVENRTEELIGLNGGAAMAPGEELSPSLYANILPDTMAVVNCSFYTADYSGIVDASTIPFADILFRFDLNGGDDAFLTEPVKIKLGTEQCFAVSEDGKSMELKQVFWKYDSSEWVVTSSNGDVLAVDKVETAEDMPTEGYQTMTAKLLVNAPGETTVTIKYHPVGESLEETEDYWPIVYCSREYRFIVNEDGTVTPGDVWLEVPNYSDEGTNSFWYYIIKNDGSVSQKNDAAG